MSTIIRIHFVRSEYHAHPWGKAQFAIGEPEWPPSPFRLLRAIAAAWFSQSTPPGTEQDRDLLLETLGRANVMIHVPKSIFRHIVYYQPVIKTVKKNKKSTRVEHRDYYAILKTPDVYFEFDADLNTNQIRLLDAMLARIKYFGRVESLAELARVENIPISQQLYKAEPVSANGADGSIRLTLCPTSDFVASDLWKVRSAGAWSANTMPPHLVTTLLDEKQSLPDGSERIPYLLPSDAIVHEFPGVDREQHNPKTKQVYSVSFSVSRSIPIHLKESVPLTRQFRNMVLSRFSKRYPQRHSLILSGKDSHNQRDTNHQHAYWVPRIQSGQIKGMDVVLPTNKLSPEDLNALTGIFKTTIRSAPEYPVILAYEGYRPIKTRGGAVWVSSTPFVPPRHIKVNRPDTWPVNQLVRLLRIQGITVVRARPHYINGAYKMSVAVHDYYGNGRYRFTKKVGYLFEIVTDQEVSTILPVGLDCHFGLGNFVNKLDVHHVQ